MPRAVRTMPRRISYPESHQRRAPPPCENLRRHAAYGQRRPIRWPLSPVSKPRQRRPLAECRRRSAAAWSGNRRQPQTYPTKSRSSRPAPKGQRRSPRLRRWEGTTASCLWGLCRFRRACFNQACAGFCPKSNACEKVFLHSRNSLGNGAKKSHMSLKSLGKSRIKRSSFARD